MDNERNLPFWSSCYKVFDKVEETDLKGIMVLLKIDRDTRNSVKEAKEFVDILEEKDIVREGNCDNLITLLRENDYGNLAGELQRCQDDLKQDKKITSKGSNLDVCEDHSASKEAVCLSCFERICFACAFQSHPEHKITAMDKLDDELQEATGALQMELTSIEKKLTLFRAHINTQEDAVNERLEDELETLTKSFQEQFCHQKHHLDEMCESNTLYDEKETEHYKALFEDVKTFVHFCNEAANTVLHETNFSRLQHLNELKRKIDNNETKLDKCRKHFLDCLSKNQYRPVSMSAKVASLAHGQVIGAVKVTRLQMIMVRNHQDSKNYVHIACLSCDKPEVLFWERTFEITKNPPFIVMANTLIILPKSIMILVGFGRKLLVSSIHVDSEIEQSFFRSSKIIELDIPLTAHVTGICGVVGGRNHKGIITTDSKSGMFHMFDQTFDSCETIKCTENSQGVTSIQEDKLHKIATIVNSSSVYLFRRHVSSKELIRVGKIDSNYLCGEMVVQSMFYDGSFLSVLWVSKIDNYDDGIQWRVVAYDDDGDEYNVSAEGKCEPSVKPISISHVKNKTLLCFSDGSVKEFNTGKLDDLDFLGGSELVNALTQNPGNVLGELTRMLMKAIEFPQ